MADINVLDLTEVTPGSNDDLILFDRDTGEAKSTRYGTLKNAVTGDVDSQIQTLTNNDDAMLNVLGAKNLLPNNATSQTINGVTFTVNSDGSVTVNGTSTANAILTLANEVSILESGKEYILSGCPSGGSESTYRIDGFDRSGHNYFDTGNGVNIAADGTAVSFRIVVLNGTTVSNLVFKPMIRPASVADDTYVPYAMTNRELMKVPNTISSGVSGVGWVKIGRVVTVLFNQLVINGTTATGIPKAACNSVVSLRDETAGGVAHIVLNSAGSFMPDAGQTGYTAGHKYSGMFSYISAT